MTKLTGPILRAAREHAHLSQEDLAEILQVTVRTVQQWESEDAPAPWPRHRAALQKFIAAQVTA